MSKFVDYLKSAENFHSGEGLKEPKNINRMLLEAIYLKGTGKSAPFKKNVNQITTILLSDLITHISFKTKTLIPEVFDKTVDMVASTHEQSETLLEKIINSGSEDDIKDALVFIESALLDIKAWSKSAAEKKRRDGIWKDKKFLIRIGVAIVAAIFGLTALLLTIGLIPA